MNRALVSGASGFIGRVLCTRLQRDGIAVRAVMRNPVPGPWEESRAVDLGRDPVRASLLERVDTVFHLAGKAHAVSLQSGDSDDHRRITVEGTHSLLTAAAASRIARFVFFSSVKAGGECSDVCLDEAMEDNPETAYGRAKLEAERLVFKFAREHGMHAVVLRLPLVYGPGHKGNLERMLDAVAARRFPPLPEFGNHRSMVHVEDVAEAAILAAESPDANVQTYIVTDGRPYSTREIYALMRVALGRRKPRLSLPISALRTAAHFGDLMVRMRGRRFFFDSQALEKLSSSAWYSSRKLETELGFKPAYDLERALPQMIAELSRGPARRSQSAVSP